MLSVLIAASTVARWQHPEMQGVVLHGCTLRTCTLRLDGQGPGGPGVVVASWASVVCQERL